MGLFDSLRAMLGISAESDATTKADHEDLFGMSTAYLTMEADLRFDSADEAALCFSSVDSTDFVDTVRSVVGGDHPSEVQEDDCTAFIVPDARCDGQGFYGQTWDMHDTATPYVVLLRLRPEDGQAALVFTTTGCLGQLGMNEAGVCVGINNLVAGCDVDLGGA